MRRYPAEPLSPLAPWSRRLGWAAVALALISIAGVRFGGVQPLNGLVVLGFAIGAAALAAVSGLGALWTIWARGGPGAGVAVRGFLLAVLVLAPVGWFGALALRLPMINDVATDTADPPSFGRSRAAIDGRGGLVPAEYTGAFAQEQQEAYPGVQPIILDLRPEEAMSLALRAATNLGWRVLDSSPPAARTGVGRIEASARSLAFGFNDDITVRVRAGVDETRIDLRSTSRIGRHDFGANAARIMAFQREIEALALQR